MSKFVKILFWLLITVNVIFFAVMKSGLLGDGQDVIVLRPLHDEKIALATELPSASAESSVASAVIAASSAVATSAVVSSLDVVPLEIKAASAPVLAKANAVSCFEWGEFSGVELDRVTKSLHKLQLRDKLSQHDVEHSIGYWVYIPPLKDKAAVAQKLVQLKARGVTDYFVVQDSGEWFNAISLGVFKTQESAQSFLEGLRAKEVSTAHVGERAGKNKTTTFIINGLDESMSEKLIALQKNFSSIELKHVSCH
jgi:hypothetical protein